MRLFRVNELKASSPKHSICHGVSAATCEHLHSSLLHSSLHFFLVWTTTRSSWKSLCPFLGKEECERSWEVAKAYLCPLGHSPLFAHFPFIRPLPSHGTTTYLFTRPPSPGPRVVLLPTVHRHCRHRPICWLNVPPGVLHSWIISEDRGSEPPP